MVVRINLVTPFYLHHTGQAAQAVGTRLSATEDVVKELTCDSAAGSFW